QAIAEFQGVEPSVVERHCYWHAGQAGVRHLFRVVAGLESLVLGEDQIVRQAKEAYDWALAQRFAGPLLNPLFQRAFSVGKDVRTDTALGKHKLSIASVAVDLARHIHGDLSDARLLVLGAGEMAELAVTYLMEHGVRHIGIVNRNQDRALAIAERSGAQVHPWAELSAALVSHDIVVSSTAAPHHVVSESDVRAAMHRGSRRGRSLLFIDLAVPRDIDPRVAHLPDVYLYNIDHLESVVAQNRKLRTEEVAAAEAVVDAHVRDYSASHRPGQSVLLARVSSFFQDIVAAEEVRLAAKLGVTDRAELRYGLERVANKLQHQILAYLRENAGNPQAEETVKGLLGMAADELKKSG
ncbi:MAG: glutamyl-tRNA reductase, partial [Planctomycetes bacterium]|nr:glutamyl-tRNA reductase [Planctomycetota bacterium]